MYFLASFLTPPIWYNFCIQCVLCWNVLTQIFCFQETSKAKRALLQDCLPRCSVVHRMHAGIQRDNLVPVVGPGPIEHIGKRFRIHRRVAGAGKWYREHQRNIVHIGTHPDARSSALWIMAGDIRGHLSRYLHNTDGGGKCPRAPRLHRRQEHSAA